MNSSGVAVASGGDRLMIGRMGSDWIIEEGRTAAHLTMAAHGGPQCCGSALPARESHCFHDRRETRAVEQACEDWFGADVDEPRIAIGPGALQPVE